jgi:hypothetical protein
MEGRMSSDIVCKVCQINKVARTGDLCLSCAEAVENNEPWALAMLELDREEKNAARREVDIDDPTPDELGKRNATDMDDVLDRFGTEMGFTPGEWEHFKQVYGDIYIGFDILWAEQSLSLDAMFALLLKCSGDYRYEYKNGHKRDTKPGTQVVFFNDYRKRFNAKARPINQRRYQELIKLAKDKLLGISGQIKGK